MVRSAIVILEALCVAAAVVLAILWVREPAAQVYEPELQLIGGIVMSLELLRRYVRSTQLRFFLSVGATYTEEQEGYVDAFEKLMRAEHVERLVVGRDAPALRQPILEVKEKIRKADAVVVIAFTRYVIVAGTEKPGANRPKHKQHAITNEKHPTVWNQIEAGIAFGLGTPLLVIVEEGIKQEAMLKDRLEFKAITAPLDAKFFDTPDFRIQFGEFMKIARRRSFFRL